MDKKPEEGETRKTTFKSNNVMYEIYIKGEWVFHRLDGPAIIYSGELEYYFVLGINMSYKEFMIKTTKLGKILYG